MFFATIQTKERLRRAVRSISINCDWWQTLGACTSSVLDDDDDDGDMVSLLLLFALFVDSFEHVAEKRSINKAKRKQQLPFYLLQL